MMEGTKKFLTDVTTDETNKVFSSSQMWFHLTNFIILTGYGFIVYKSIDHPNIPIESISIFTLIISGIITGNKLATRLMDKKYGTTEDNNVDRTNK